MLPNDLRLARVPRHVGFIPDGNRRWAQERGAAKREGYAAGILPGIELLQTCRTLGIAEVSIYGFTKENVHRPADQVSSFRAACVDFALQAVGVNAALRVYGDTDSTAFPVELRAMADQRTPGDLRVNLLVNYGWQWDLGSVAKTGALASADIPRVELVVRWGG